MFTKFFPCIILCCDVVKGCYLIGRYHLVDLGMGGMILLKLILKKWGLRVWIEFLWFRIECSVWVL
jgi:hypothetical protein